MCKFAIRKFSGALAVLLVCGLGTAKGQDPNSAPTQFNHSTIAELEAEMNAGRLTSVQLVQYYLDRIAALDPGVNAIMQLNPNALKLAAQADRMRGPGATTKYPLLGIPVLLKDNTDTHDNMQTTAGSFALFGQPATMDSTVAAHLRAAGAVILGKTNLSEWANYRSTFSTSGWSGRGGLTHNPYSEDRNACGSSSGSGAAASANFTTVSFGSETDGSIVCPASVNGVVGIKPTVGLVSRAGVVPISHNQDTVGPHARYVADAARALNAVIWRSAGADPRDPYTGGVPLGWEACNTPSPAVACSTNMPEAGKSRPVSFLQTVDYTKYLDPNGLNGKTLGMTRSGITIAPPQVENAFYAAINAMVNAGASIIDLDNMNCAGITSGCTNGNVNLFAPDAAGFDAGSGELVVLDYDFKNDLAKYFSSRVNVPVSCVTANPLANCGTLEAAIEFNSNHASIEMPYFGQEIFLQAQAFNGGALINTDPTVCEPGFTTSPPCTYNDALVADHQLGVNIDKALSSGLAAIVAPTDSPGWTTDLILADHFLFASSGIAGPPGYPIINVPAGDVLGMPVGVSFIGTAFSEPTLIGLASGFEAVTHARFDPTFSPDITTAHTAGTFFAHPPVTAAPPKKHPHHM